MPDDVFDSPAGAGDLDAGVPRDKQYGRYVLPSPDGRPERLINTKDHGAIRGVVLTRTTTFAKSISDTYTLNQWGNRMAVKGITMDSGLYRKAGTLDVTKDRDEFNQLVERAQEIAGSKVRASIGTALHNYTEAMDSEEHPTVPVEYAAELAAYQRLVDKLGIQMVYIERVICCPQYDLGGTFDRIVTFSRDITVKFPGYPPLVIPAGTPVILDLKTGRDLSYGWGEIAIQLTVYTDSPLMWFTNSKQPNADGTYGAFERKPVTHPDVGFVIHVPVRDDPMGKAVATLYAVNLTVGRAAVDLARQVRNFRKMRGLTAAIGTVTVTERTARELYAGSIQPVIEGEIIPAIASAPSYATRILSASSPAELSAIYREAASQGRWTPDLEALGHEQMSKLRSV